MRVLLLNQAFYPDVVSTAQYLADVALELRSSGHDVTVLAGASAYDDPSVRFPRRETWKGIRILRIGGIRLGKRSRWRRAIDFGSFMVACMTRLAILPRFDVVVALTSPPLIATIGRWFVRLKGGRLVFWVMDLNPDEAIAAGWLRPRSIPARVLEHALRQSLHGADRVVVLDRFMKDRVISKGVAPEAVAVIPPWSHEDDVRFDSEARAEFRQANGLDNTFVVMYAGNHSPCNPLDTLVSAVILLKDRNDIRFCFVGGGSDFDRVRRELQDAGADNAVFVRYRPRHELAGVLSAADLHVVSMGDPFVGILHPCKVYNALRVGAPILYIGPRVSHIGDLAQVTPNRIVRVAHGDADRVVDAITKASTARQHASQNEISSMTRDVLLAEFMQALNSTNARQPEFGPATV
jgi:putative colanic acid biosynthesis glycosyltransferase WcaI